LPEARPEASAGVTTSAGVTIGSAGVAVPAGAKASVSETAAGRGVGGGIRLDSNNRTGPVAEGTTPAGPSAELRAELAAAGSGVDASEACVPASTTGPDKVGATAAAGVGSARFRPQAWQLVWPWKTSRAPQNWQVCFSGPDSSVTLNP
jgi:hypothetical protein